MRFSWPLENKETKVGPFFMGNFASSYPQELKMFWPSHFESHSYFLHRNWKSLNFDVSQFCIPIRYRNMSYLIWKDRCLDIYSLKFIYKGGWKLQFYCIWKTSVQSFGTMIHEINPYVGHLEDWMTRSPYLFCLLPTLLFHHLQRPFLFPLQNQEFATEH